MSGTRRSFLLQSGAAAMVTHPLIGALGESPAEQQDSSVGAVTTETAFGKVRGASVKGVTIFRGIPYGGPTEGTSRFLPPSKPDRWVGLRDATRNGPRCIQAPGNLFVNQLVGAYFSGGRADAGEQVEQQDSENCLVLNVLTPGTQGKRPVMVYIHGGGYVTGSAALTLLSDRFVREQDIVLVGVNHRLNVFGYTYLGELSDRFGIGNPGQLDLIAALEWVRDNIGHFGGDSNKVTIFGESGGGAKVSTLLAMPAAKGLFQRAIVQSGSLLRCGDVDAATERTRSLMSSLNVGKVEELQKVRAANLYKAASEVARKGGGGLSAGPSPVIDGHSLPHQTWDPKAPEEAAGVPMIIGNCKDESTLFALGDQSLYLLDDAGLRRAVVKAGIPEDKVDGLLNLYKRDHPKEDPSDLYFRISTDRGARHNTVRQAELKIAQGSGKAFVYYFQWNSGLMDGKLRAFHTSDLPLEMRLVLKPEAERLSKQLSSAWAAFARTGDPSQNGLPWPAYTTSQRVVMMWDATRSEAVSDPDHEERVALQNLPSGALL